MDQQISHSYRIMNNPVLALVGWEYVFYEAFPLDLPSSTEISNAAKVIALPMKAIQ